MATIAILLVVGALLLFLETVLPGLIAGIIGVGCIIAAVAMAYARFDFQTGNTILAIAVGGLIIGAGLYLRYFPNSRVAQNFISNRSIDGANAASPLLLDKTGQTLTALRPSGKALIDGQQHDVTSEGGFIERGQKIKVIAVEGRRIVVRMADPA